MPPTRRKLLCRDFAPRSGDEIEPSKRRARALRVLKTGCASHPAFLSRTHSLPMNKRLATHALRPMAKAGRRAGVAGIAAVEGLLGPEAPQQLVGARGPQPLSCVRRVRPPTHTPPRRCPH